MKNTTRILALLLALVLTLGLGVTAFAEDTAAEKGTITVNKAVSGQKYTIYKILYLESYNAASGAYSYKATADWSDFIKSTAVKDVYVKVDNQGYVTWIKDADAAAFAKAALAYAGEKKVANQGSKDAEGTTVTFENLELGYYLLDSSLGTLCSLNTTNPNATVEEKNAVPTNKKEVQEDSNGNYGTVNDAELGQTVSFRSTVTLPAGSQNVIFHDTMEGLTLNADSVKVYTDANMTAELSAGSYTVTPSATDGCSFEVAFAQTYLNDLSAETKLYIGYSATLNADAVVGGAGNPNTSHVTYGEKNNSTPDSTTRTYTWSFDVLKFGNNDKNKLLKGAQFVLLNSDKTQVAKFQGDKLNGWESVPTAGKDDTISWPAEAVMTTNENGKIAIVGLDAGTYYLREIKAPDGYNTLKGDESVQINPEPGKDAQSGDTLTLAAVTAEVNNQSGTQLPSTGGVGTTIFYVLGGILAVGAAVLLIARKRAERA